MKRIIVFICFIIITLPNCINVFADNYYASVSSNVYVGSKMYDVMSSNSLGDLTPSTSSNPGYIDLTIAPTTNQYVDGSSLVVTGSFSLYTDEIDDFSLENFYPSLVGFIRKDDGTFEVSQPLPLNNYITSFGGYRYSSIPFNYTIDFSVSFNNNSSTDRYQYSNVNVSYVFVSDFPHRAKDYTFRFVCSTGISSKLFVNGSYFNYFVVEAPSTEIVDALSSITTINSNGFNGVSAAVNALSVVTQSNYSDVKSLMNDLNSKVDSLEQSIPDSVQSALDEWETENLNSSKSEVTDAVDQVQEKLDDVFDFSDIQEATSIIYDAVSTDSMDPQLDIPSFTLNILGQSFTFWDDIHFDFHSIYNTLTSIAVFNGLLSVFRFSIVVGCIYYCWHWLNKLINLVLLESDGSYGTVTHDLRTPVQKEILNRKKGG